MASNDNNKCKYDEDESVVLVKRWMPNRDDDGNDSSSGTSEEETMNPEQEEVSSKEDINLLDSKEKNLFQRQACSDDGNTSESQDDSIGNAYHPLLLFIVATVRCC
jgi:hypothetical protein